MFTLDEELVKELVHSINPNVHKLSPIAFSVTPMGAPGPSNPVLQQFLGVQWLQVIYVNEGMLPSGFGRGLNGRDCLFDYAAEPAAPWDNAGL